MDNTQNLGQPVGKVTTTYNGEKNSGQCLCRPFCHPSGWHGAQGQAGSGRCPHR